MKNLFMNWNWAPHVLSIELKKAFSYRVAFWVQFLFGTATELTVAYFLWKAIFAARGASEIQGFTFFGMVYYYLFASFAGKIARGSDRGYFSMDIYDGGLTRYLLYPLPFFGFKYITHLTQQLLGLFQLLLAFAFLWLAMGLPPGHHLSLGSFFAGCLTCVLAGYLHFTMMACLEMVAFWQDVVWNLMAMLRFSMNLLGGAMVPISFFPHWGQHLVYLTPFPVLVSFPTRTFLGEVGLNEWLLNAAMIGFWSLVFSLLAQQIWIRGTKQYSGVGI